jgi:hypothetical protein
VRYDEGMTEASDYEFNSEIDAKMRRAVSFFPRWIRWPSFFTNRRHDKLFEEYGSFLNLLDDGIYFFALHDLIVVASLYEKDGSKLPTEFWTLIDELAVDVDATDDYRDWRIEV